MLSAGADEHCAVGAPGDDLNTSVPPVKSRHFDTVHTWDSLYPVFVVDSCVTWTDHPRHTVLSPTWVALKLVQIYPTKSGVAICSGNGDRNKNVLGRTAGRRPFRGGRLTEVLLRELGIED